MPSDICAINVCKLFKLIMNACLNFTHGVWKFKGGCTHYVNIVKALAIYVLFKWTDGPQNGDVRLTNYYYYYYVYESGRVYGYPEVFLSGSWEPVTDSSRSWTQENSNVVCRELGYKG